MATAMSTASSLRFFIIPAPKDEEAGRMYQKTVLEISWQTYKALVYLITMGTCIPWAFGFA